MRRGFCKELLLTSRIDVEREKGGPGKAPAKLELRGRQNSLRHVKDSTEMLRQRPTRRAVKDGISDANAGMREGRHFTVANVGNNGNIYLKCVSKLSASALLCTRRNAGGDCWMNSLICCVGQTSIRPKASGATVYLPRCHLVG